MSNSINIGVTAKECRGKYDKMIRKFNKKEKKERIIEQVKDRKHYKKPSVAKKEKRARAARARLREHLKKQRAQERMKRVNT